MLYNQSIIVKRRKLPSLFEGYLTTRQEKVVAWSKWIIGEVMRSGQILDILYFEGRMYRICERIGCGVGEERRSAGWLQYFRPENWFYHLLNWERLQETSRQFCPSIDKFPFTRHLPNYPLDLSRSYLLPSCFNSL